MARSDVSAPGWPSSGDGASAARASRDARLHSILFEHAEPDGAVRIREPDCFADLNLDQVLPAMTAGREEYELEPFFYATLHDAAAVRYRHEVLHDLERPEALASVTCFAQAMRRMREHLGQAEAARHQLPKEAWFVDAVEVYREAVRSLAAELSDHEIASRGLRRLSEHLCEYEASERFTSLAEETAAVKEAARGIRYRLRIQGPRVTVGRYEGEGDYSVEVLQTFTRFRQGAVKSHLVRLPEEAGMNHIELQILERAARLHPGPFEKRAEYCARHGDFLDETVPGLIARCSSTSATWS